MGTKTRFIGVAGFNEMELTTVKVLNAAFDKLQLNTRCLPFDFKSMDQLPKMLDILKVPAVISTGDYGKRLLSMAKPADEVTQQTASADLLLKQPDGWQGYNLMWKLALKSLEAKLGKKSAEDRPLEGRNVIIVGAGGMGQAMVVGVKKRHGIVSICDGDDDKAKATAQATEIRYIPAAKLYDTLTDMVILTTPNLDHGMKKVPISTSLLRPNMLIMDLTDPPGESPLCTEARERGCKVVEPTEIFAEYLAALFKSLTGQDLPPDAVATGLGG